MVVCLGAVIIFNVSFIDVVVFVLFIDAAVALSFCFILVSLLCISVVILVSVSVLAHVDLIPENENRKQGVCLESFILKIRMKRILGAPVPLVSFFLCSSFRRIDLRVNFLSFEMCDVTLPTALTCGTAEKKISRGGV